MNNKLMYMSYTYFMYRTCWCDWTQGLYRWYRSSWWHWCYWCFGHRNSADQTTIYQSSWMSRWTTAMIYSIPNVNETNQHRCLQHCDIFHALRTAVLNKITRNWQATAVWICVWCKHISDSTVLRDFVIFSLKSNDCCILGQLRPFDLERLVVSLKF